MSGCTLRRFVDILSSMSFRQDGDLPIRCVQRCVLFGRALPKTLDTVGSNVSENKISSRYSDVRCLGCHRSALEPSREEEVAIHRPPLPCNVTHNPGYHIHFTHVHPDTPPHIRSLVFSDVTTEGECNVSVSFAVRHSISSYFQLRRSDSSTMSRTPASQRCA